MPSASTNKDHLGFFYSPEICLTNLMLDLFDQEKYLQLLIYEHLSIEIHVSKLH